MKRKLILRLCLMTAVILSLYSCVHDEVYASSDPYSTEYVNKSLWKQDEKYIKNVMGVYLEHEEEIKKTAGTPYWNYATTINNFDESFVAVPVVENGKVVSVLKVPRHGKKIYFYYTQEKSDLTFFQGLVFAKHKKLMDDSAAMAERIECRRQWVSVWLPDNEANPDPSNGSGNWHNVSVIICKALKDECIGIALPNGDCDMGGGGYEDGYEYPGGGGKTPEEEEENPCDKLKTQNQNTVFKGKVSALDKAEMFNKTEETGYAAAYGTIPYEQMLNTDNGNVKLPPGNKYFGYMHTHLNLEGVIKIFSPYDVATFLTSCVANAKLTGNISDAYAMVITSQGNYMLQYSGDGNFAITVGQFESWKTWYIDEYSKLNLNDLSNSAILEKIFTKFLQEVVNINGLELYKTEKTTGKATKLQYNATNNSVQPIPCPN